MFNRREVLFSLAAASVPSISLAQATNVYGTPGRTVPFTPDVYKARRAALMAQIKGGVAVVYSSDSLGRGQNPDFFYLTGIVDEAGAALVLAPEERTYKEVLFLKNRDPESERYDGDRLPISAEIEARTGIARSRRMSTLGSTVQQFATRAPALHFLGPLASPGSPVPKALELYSSIAQRTPGVSTKNSWGILPAMRVAKEQREIDLMRKAVAATERGLRAAMRKAKPGMREFDIKDIIEAEFKLGGARGLAFESIVGAGRTSAVLHYPLDNNAVKAGDMILCDVGAEYDYYASDITRTFPVDGRFTPEQKKIYELVLRAQEAAMKVLKPGVVYEELQLAADQVFREAGMIDAFWHGLGHFVGLEVHDTGDYTKSLPAGAIVTIEPGLYLPEQGFGVRIEDQFLVTRNGYEHMTKSVPRTVVEIEAWMAGR